MSRFPVEAPVPAVVPRAAVATLGRLGPALGWLASVQGCWPPEEPRAVRTVVIADGAVVDAGDDAATSRAFVDAGVAEADEAADAGVDMLVLGASGEQVPGLVAAAVLLRLEPVEAVGTVAGPAWAARTLGVREGVVALRPHASEPDRLLEALASPVVGRATGLLAQSAVRRTPVVLDGSPIVLAAALLAARLAPGAQRWWLAGQAPPSPAGARALSELGLEPLVDLRLERPEGAALAHLVLVRALDLVRRSEE